jgi:GntR family transcriptional regulator, transcriptional repressor for pyruvate dehydrogenase complex
VPQKLAYEEVAARLKKRIMAGKLAAGHRLPTEAELCEQFGVSRSTVREALRVLSSQGLVTTSRGVGGGTSIARLDHTDVAEMLDANIMLLTSMEGCSVGELLEARDFLEVPAARLAAARRTEQQLVELRATIPAAPHSLPVRRRYQADRAFHQAILEAAGNRMLQIVTAPVFTAMQARFLGEVATEEFWARVIDEHRAILRAIEAGDPERAGREMASHLRSLRTSEDLDAGPVAGETDRAIAAPYDDL